MNAKQIITSDFNKSEFKIEGKVDSFVKDFILKINKSEHILTKYCCEGHYKSGLPNAYLFFTVDEIGWDIFWLNILPELCIGNEKINFHIETATKYNTGIIIRLYNLKYKEIFWSKIKEIFYKYYL